MEEQQEPINVNIVCPPNKPVKFQVSSLNAHSITLIFFLHPEFIFLTNYDLITKNGSIYDQNHDFSADIETDNSNKKNDKKVTITVQNLPYTEIAAISHSKTLARIFFTLSSRRQFTDCHQSVANWINQAYSSSLPGVDDLKGIYPEPFIKNDLPRPIKFMDLSSTPLTMKERIEGVLLKLDIITCEKESLSVYCTKDGWHSNQKLSKQNKRKTYPTLHHLLLTISQRYSDLIPLIAEKWCNLMAYERQSFSPINIPTVFMMKKLNKAGEVTNYTPLKLFQTNEDENCFSSLTIDDLLNDIRNETDEYRSCGIYSNKIEMQYAQQAVDGVKMIERGNLSPYEDSQNYVWKEFFIANIEYIAELQKNRGGLVTANKQICNEIKSYQQFALNTLANPNFLNTNLRVVRTVIIDYFTNRWIAQSIIPGLLTQQSKIVYGFNLNDRSQYMHQEFFDDAFKKISRQLGIAASKIKASEQPIYCSSELNGVEATDGYFYAVDFRRITPRDANYPDPVKNHAFVIRQEAIRNYEAHLAHQEEQKNEDKNSKDQKNSNDLKKSENVNNSNDLKKSENVNNSNDLKKSEDVNNGVGLNYELDDSQSPECFDINALTLDSALGPNETPKNILDLAHFMTDVHIPKFIDEYAKMGKFVVDGQTIVNEMHLRGINVRYLGRIHDHLSSEKVITEEVKYFITALESEMISRSFKTIMKTEKADLNRFLSSLNLLLGYADNSSEFEKLFNEISNVSNDKFGVKPKPPQKCQRFMLLRSILRPFGISLYSRDFGNSEEPITADDIALISPVVKFPFSRNPQFQSQIELAVTMFNNNEYESAFQLFNLSLQTSSENSVQPFDEGISMCYFYLSLIFERKGDFKSAFASCLKSLIVQENVNDQPCPDIAIKYYLLGRYAQQLGSLTLSFAFADRAANLASVIFPGHPWVNAQFLNAAIFAFNASPSFAIKYCQSKLSFCNTETEEGKKQKAMFFRIMANSAVLINDIQSAVQYEKSASLLDPQPENQDKNSNSNE